MSERLADEECACACVVRRLGENRLLCLHVGTNISKFMSAVQVEQGWVECEGSLVKGEIMEACVTVMYMYVGMCVSYEVRHV